MVNHQINLSEITPIEHLQFEPLDIRFKSAYTIGVILRYLLLASLSLLLLLCPDIWPCIAAECVLCISCIINLLILKKIYLFRGYALRQQDITYRKGIIFPKTTTIPYSRIQQVSVSQNPVSKFFHLYEIVVENGAQSLQSLAIPGLSEEKAIQIKDVITENLRNNHD